MKILVFFVGFVLTMSSLSAQTDFQFDVSKMPFSCYGSALSFSAIDRGENKENILHLYDVSGEKIWQWNGLFKFETTDTNGITIACEYFSTPSTLTLIASSGKVDICFENENTIRFRLNGVGLKISNTVQGRDRLILKISDNQWRSMSNPRFVMTLKNGKASLAVDQQMTVDPHTQSVVFSNDTTQTFNNSTDPILILPNKTGNAELILERYLSEWRSHEYSIPFEQCVDKQKNAFTNWINDYELKEGIYKTTALKAAYLEWASVIAPFDAMPRYGVLMSKNWMNNVWSWDHCFTAMSLEKFQPNAAWDQLMIPFDRQDSMGALPDYINTKHICRTITKPPIHGWALQKMMKSGNITNDQLKEIYPKMEKWTSFWLSERISKNGFPQYFDWYDSGLDNGSVFDMGCPVESPDLCAYLVIQMETLANVALKLGLKKDATIWKNKSSDLLKRMIDYFWNGDKFIVKRTFDGKWNEKSHSLFNYLPLVLGHRLPEAIRSKMINDLKDKNGLLSPFGLMTEHPTSTYYTSDGYWRGPIWAPTTLLIVDGINDAGDPEFAKEIARRFCDMINNNGFYENFDAVTGKGLRDPAYTWTSGVFMILVDEYLK